MWVLGAIGIGAVAAGSVYSSPGLAEHREIIAPWHRGRQLSSGPKR